MSCMTLHSEFWGFCHTTIFCPATSIESGIAPASIAFTSPIGNHAPSFPASASILGGIDCGRRVRVFCCHGANREPNNGFRLNCAPCLTPNRKSLPQELLKSRRTIRITQLFMLLTIGVIYRLDGNLSKEYLDYWTFLVGEEFGISKTGLAPWSRPEGV